MSSSRDAVPGKLHWETGLTSLVKTQGHLMSGNLIMQFNWCFPSGCNVINIVS